MGSSTVIYCVVLEATDISILSFQLKYILKLIYNQHQSLGFPLLSTNYYTPRNKIHICLNRNVKMLIYLKHL